MRVAGLYEVVFLAAGRLILASHQLPTAS